MRFILKYIMLLFGYTNLNNKYKNIDYTTKEWEDYKETLKRIGKWKRNGQSCIGEY